MFSTRIGRPFSLLLALALAASVGACADNPIGDDHEDHPVALALINAQGQSVVTISEGTSGAAVSGQITLAVNGAQTFTVVALGEDGDRLALDGDELAVQVGAAPQNATVTLQGNDRLTVTGRSTGSGSVVLTLEHEGHAELEGAVPVVVQ